MCSAKIEVKNRQIATNAFSREKYRFTVLLTIAKKIDFFGKIILRKNRQIATDAFSREIEKCHFAQKCKKNKYFFMGKNFTKKNRQIATDAFSRQKCRFTVLLKIIKM